MTGPFIICFMLVSLSLLLVSWVLWILLFILRLMTLVNSKCITFCIPTPLIFVAKFLSSLLCIGRVTLYLKVPESFSLILPTVPISFIIFFKIMDDFVLEKGVMLGLIGLSNFWFYFLYKYWS